MTHTFVFCTRRLFMVAICKMVSSHAAIQIFLFLGLQVGYMGYLLLTRAQDSPFMNRLELLDEAATYLIAITFLCFTEWIPSLLFQYQVGWFLVYFTCVGLVWHLCVLVKDLAK